ILPGSQISFIAIEFVAQNIGGTGGSLNRIADGQFDVNGAGKDIGGTADHFEYAWQPRSGDFDLQVRLKDVKITDAFVHAGLMARATLDTNSAFAGIFAASARVGSFFESRATTGATATTTAAGAYPANYPQAWLRLKRVGNVFTGYGSLDGIGWVQLGTATITMPTQIYFGLALSSESATQTSFAQFRDFGTTVSTATGAAYKAEHEPLAPSSRSTGLVFSEVMYHPLPDARFVNDLEFVEIYNADDMFEDLTGYQLTGGINYKFPNGYILPAGAFVVVALDPNAVRTAYGVTNVLGPYTGKLDNSGDTIELRDGFGALKLSMDYNDHEPWPVAADGAGHSIVLTRPSYGEGDPRAWSASSQIGGSPGRDDLIVTNPQKEVWINEFLVNSDGTQEPFVELYNHNTVSVDVSGCYITDSPTTNKFKIPAGTTINARSFRSFPASQLGFTMSGSGGVLYLVSSNALRVIDAISFNGQEAGVSTGRSPDGSATIRRLSAPTPGAANAQWKVEDLVINEIMYAPISQNKDDQYIELYNRSGSAINLANWKVEGGVDFTFPAGATIPANGYVVVARNRDQILSNYANLNTGNTFGNYSGSLGKIDHIELSKVGTWVTTNQFSQLVTNGIRITTAEVAYVGAGRWSKYSKEGGSSLELIDPHGDMLRQANWADSDETQKAPWTTNTFTGVLDNGNGSYAPDRLYVFMQDGGECLIDDISIVRTGTTLASFNFDAGATGWSFFGDHSRSTVEATGGFNNSGVLHLRADDKGMQGINSVQTALTGLASGNTVTITAKTRWMAGYQEVLLRTRGGWIELPCRMSVPKNLGTPGLPNSRLRPTQNAGPAIYDVSHAPILPRANNAVTVTCKVSDADGIGPVILQYRVDPSGTYTSVTMRDDGTGGDAIAGDGIYSGNIPGQASGALVGFRINASDVNIVSPATTTFPAGNMWQVALPSPECYVRWNDTLPSGTFAYYYLWDTQASEAQRSNALNNTYRDATLVYNTWRVIYNCGFRDKGSPYHGGAGSWAVMNPDDEPLLGDTDRIFRSTGNGNQDSVPVRNRLTQWMARKMSIPYLNSHYMQLFRNGSQFANVMQDEEYPGVGYSKEWFPDGSNGDVYKIAVWFEFANDNSSFGATGSTLESFKSGGNYKLARYRWNWNTRGFMGTANNYTNIYNLVTAANDTSTNMVQNVLNIADVEEWMRVFAYDRVLGNWDSWTYNVGQNMFAVKQAGLPWQIMPWDIDFTLGAGDGATTPLMNGGQDPVMNTWFNVPAFRRMFWRGYQKSLVAALDPAQYTPIGDALQTAMVRNNISGAGGPSALYSYMAQRRSFIQGQIAANDVASFTITQGNFTSATPTTVLTGKAPFAVVSVAVNGTPYPTVWTDQNSWSINVPLATGQNVLTVTGVDSKGVLVPGNTASITVTYNGVAQLPQDYVVINEVHYNPAEPNASFIELYNNSTTTPFDLSGYRMDGVGYTFPDGSIIQPSKFALLVGHRAGFALAYGQTIPVMGEFPGNLDHSGESISLVKPLGMGGTNDLIISDVNYSSSLPWPTNANGFGPSLQLIDPTKGSYRVANWATTSNTDPNRVTPGRTNLVKSTIAAFPTLWINEVLPNNINGPLDNAGEHEPFIELYNSGTSSVNLSGLYLSDDYNNLTKWALPATSLGAKQFLRIWADGQTAQTIAGAPHTSFRLNPTSGSVALSRMQTTAAVIDYIDYVQITPDRSFGSYPDGEPRNRRLFSVVTPGAANDPTLPPANIKINEFMASNTSTLLDPATGHYEDWFELYNAGANDVDLTSFTLTTSLSNKTEFRIPPGYVLQSGKFLLVWADDTSSSNRIGDPALHASFKLTKAGGDIGLFDPDGNLIDGFTYVDQTNDISMGHFPDGDSGQQVAFDIPTPGSANVLSGANQPPVLSAIPDKTVTEQTLLQFTASATDPDAGQTIQYSLGVGSPAGAAINPTTGAFTWTPTEQQGPNTYSVSVVATDNGSPPRSTVKSFNVTVNEANRAPTLAAISNATIDDSTLFAFTATATDPDVPANPLTFTLEPGAPSGTAIDPSTGRFTWTPAPAQAGTYTITVRVTDSGALSDLKSFQVTVQVVEHAPVIDNVSQQFVNEGSNFSLTIHATDPNSPPSSITYSLEGGDLPTGLTIDPVTGVMSWLPTEAQGPQTYGINVRATKNSGSHLSSAVTFGITVNEVNQKPVLGSIQNVTVAEGGLVTLNISAVDADLPKQTLSYSLLPGAPAGATIDTVSGQFTWQTPDDGAPLVNDISVVVTDDGPGALTDTNTFRVTLIPKFRATINEIMYHPSVANAAYIELINPSTVRTQDLTGIILGGPRMNFAFAAGTKLLPGQIISVVQNTTAFRNAYGAALAVAGQWTGSFDKTDAWVRLYSVDGQNNTNVFDQVNFEAVAPWSTQADAGGVSLQLIDPTRDNSRVGNWTVAPPSTGPQWQHVVQTGTASSSLMYLYLETVGDVYLDDVVLVAGTTPEVGQNFLANGDFELPLSPSWTVSPNLSQSALSTSTKHAGASSLHMVATAGGTTQGSSIYQNLATPLTQGASYTLSYWYLPNTNGGTLTLRLSGSGIKSTINILGTAQVVPQFTPDADNNVKVALAEFPPVWINEVLANNITGITDGRGQHEPWIELINTGSTPVDLTGWYLTANYATLAGWPFPSGTTIPAGGFLLIFADGQSADTTASELHASFRLPTSNGTVGLVRPQATGLAVVDYVNYGTIPNDSSLSSI
ncbi:MAG TPA: lamin tail domain-containing protein, partial [Verrucomicrobiae bacterium]